MPEALQKLAAPAAPAAGLVQTGPREWRVSEDFHVPEAITIQGTLLMACGSVVEGDLTCEDDAILADGARVEGRLQAGGVVVLSPGCHVGGGIEAARVEIYGSALVDGGIRAQRGVAFLPSPSA